MIFGIGDDCDCDCDDVTPNGKFDIIGIVAIAVAVGCSACVAMTSGGGLIIDDISVFTTGKPSKPVFVIISPLCNVSAT